MNKIIVAIDGLKYSGSAAKYAIEFAKLTKAHLVGVFLEDLTYHSFKIHELESTGPELETRISELEDKDIEIRNVSVERFEKFCQDRGVSYSIHHDRNIAIHQLLHESIYADLLVIDRKETLTRYEEKIPTRFIRDLLSNVQCPILVVPEKYQIIETTIMLYDGHPSSIHAIKMFFYLFGPLAEKVEILSVNESTRSLHLPDNRLMKEFMKRHYPDARYTVLNGNARDEIVKYIQELEKGALVVLGGHQRGIVSGWFNESMADLLMGESNCPLFIAQRK